MWRIDKNTADRYREFCNVAATNESVFHVFKTGGNYTPILEHVGQEEGKMYIEGFKDLMDRITPLIERIKKNDLRGNPKVYYYEGFGQISPTTLRYVKTCCDIIRFFGFDKFNRIVEIGGGYGGLCLVSNQILEFDSYTIYDIKEANLLAQKYLSCFEDVRNKCSNIELSDQDSNQTFDLLISNYALSELSKSAQIDYVEKILKKSLNFYIVFNQIGDLTLEEFLSMIPDYEIELEKEHSKFSEGSSSNIIIYGKRQNKF